MKTVVMKRGRITIPAAIRRKHQIREGDVLVWLDDGQSIHVIPTPSDAVAALRGSARGTDLVGKLLAARREERG